MVPLSVRLVDLCVNLMAAEHTCMHSDHSIGRCLIYGARGIPQGMACRPDGGLLSSASGHGEMDHAAEKVGMCFMTPSCNRSEQITCHRYAASRDPKTLELTTIRTVHKAGYYRFASSVFNRTTNATDSFM